jgi:hypothetical protein
LGGGKAEVGFQETAIRRASEHQRTHGKQSPSKANASSEARGGKRFETGSAEYRILLDWIRAGAAEDSNEAPHLESISVSPGVAMLTPPGNSLALKVTATFSDGEQLDVTRWAVYETSNLIAEVTPAGVVAFAQPGETKVFVRYLSGRASMREGMIKQRKSSQWSGLTPTNVIDIHVFAKLKQFRENPADRCDDATFMSLFWLFLSGFMDFLYHTYVHRSTTMH